MLTYPLLLSSLLLFVGSPARADEVLNVTGALEPGDPMLDDNSLYDVYTFEGTAGQSVAIALESTQFDTYLMLIHPNGEKIGENDDVAPNNTNSFLGGILPDDGVYTVIVNAFDETGRGTYQLQVSSEDMAPASSAPAGTIDELVQQGTQYLRTQQFAAAEQTYQQALQLAVQQGDRTAEAELYEYIAVAKIQLQDIQNAITLFEQALDLQRNLDNRPSEMRLLQNIGNAYSRFLGDRPTARAYYEQALGIAQELGDNQAEQELLGLLSGL
jgi:tetratricopeptide (TPR) repeat protein